MYKILVVEDDIDISNMLNDLLTQNGYEVTLAYSGTEAVLCFNHQVFNLILMDLMLPGKSGSEVVSEIRVISDIPIIALTAITTKESTISLLKLGADDYISKPFDNDELITRIEVQLRHQSIIQNHDKPIIYKDIVLIPERFDAVIGSESLQLSKREFSIMKLLMENPKKVFTKNNLYESIWEDEFIGDENTINVHISKLRSKLAKYSKEDYIQTVWGIGYKLQE